MVVVVEVRGVIRAEERAVFGSLFVPIRFHSSDTAIAQLNKRKRGRRIMKTRRR